MGDLEVKNNEIDEADEDIYGIMELTPKQQRFVHLYLTGRYKNAELATLLGVHTNTINNWLRKPNIKHIITEFQKDEHEVIESNLKSLRSKAIETMAELMESPIDGIRYQASRDILDRTGHKSVQKMEVKKEIYTYETQMKELVDEAIPDDLIIELMKDEYEVNEDEQDKES